MSNTFTNETKCHLFDSLRDHQLHVEKAASSQLRSQLFYLWIFIAQQDLWEDAIHFLDEHYDVPVPFDFSVSDVPF